MEILEKCSGCQKLKVIVSSDAYGQYCNECDDNNFSDDNDFPDY